MGTGIITQASVLAQSCPCTGAVGDPRQPVLDFTTDGILPPQVLLAYVERAAPTDTWPNQWWSLPSTVGAVPTSELLFWISVPAGS